MTTYRTAKGREIDMGKIVNANEMTLAVGNARVNARGDKIGPKGEIVQRREEIIAASTNQIIPNQINVRNSTVPVQSPVPTPTKKSGKDIADQDPTGDE